MVERADVAFAPFATRPPWSRTLVQYPATSREWSRGRPGSELLPRLRSPARSLSRTAAAPQRDDGRRHAAAVIASTTSARCPSVSSGYTGMLRTSAVARSLSGKSPAR